MRRDSREQRDARSWMVTALIFHMAGAVLFFCWLVETDIMFGHFEGPRWQIATATLLAILGISLSLLLMFDARRVMLLGVIPIIVSTLVVLIGVAEFTGGF